MARRTTRRDDQPAEDARPTDDAPAASKAEPQTLEEAAGPRATLTPVCWLLAVSALAFAIFAGGAPMARILTVMVAALFALAARRRTDRGQLELVGFAVVVIFLGGLLQVAGYFGH
jgi:hypothetical protein